MPFNFKLQKALDYRVHLEEEAKQMLARAQTELAASIEREHSVEEELAEAERSKYSVMENAGLWLTEQYIRGLSDDLRDARRDRRMKEELLETRRQMLATRAMERKVLDKLKERQKGLFIRAEKAQELHFNDEIATIRHKAPALEAN